MFIPSHVPFVANSNSEHCIKIRCFFHEVTGKNNLAPFLWLTVYKCSAVAEMGDPLATINGPEIWGCIPFFGGAGSPCSTMWLGSGLPSYQVAS